MTSFSELSNIIRTQKLKEQTNKCYKCSEERLDYVISFKDKILNWDNLVVICKKCHKQEHPHPVKGKHWKITGGEGQGRAGSKKVII